MGHVTASRSALGFVPVLMVGNLRGIRESGRIFAVPTYFFIVSILGMLAVGAWRYFTRRDSRRSHELAHPATAASLLTTFALLTAFSNGCTAMTGVEAVSNGVPGVPAAGEPQRRGDADDDGRAVDHDVHGHHAAGARVRARPERAGNHRVAVARGRLSAAAACRTSPSQAATMLILVLAANTAYADFPRLASIVARDRFLPRQFTNQGDRLAFSNGIIDSERALPPCSSSASAATRTR